MKQVPGKEYLVRWHPFQLNPSACPEGIEKMDFYVAKFGKERTTQMVPFMRVSPSPVPDLLVMCDEQGAAWPSGMFHSWLAGW